MDVITYLCFGQSGNAVDEPDFHDPLVEAMHNSSGIVPLFFHFKFFRKMIMGMPPDMAKSVAPETAGLVNMQQVCDDFGHAFLITRINQFTPAPPKTNRWPHKRP